MTKKFTIVLVSFICVVALAAGVSWFVVRARHTSAANSCTNNLRQLDAAKGWWALEHNKTTNDLPPTWDDVRLYLPRWLGEAGYDKPVCPGGGAYTLGSISESATCSIGGPGHSLPPLP